MTENVEDTLKRIGIRADSVQGKMATLQNKINSIDGAKLNQKIGGSLGKINTALDKSNLPGLSSLTLGINPYVAATTAAFAVTGKAVKEALLLDEAMAKVNATAQLSGEEYEFLKSKIIGVAKANKADLTESAIAYERILSQTNDVTKSTEILNVALKGAKAGFTDSVTIASALARITSAIGDKAGNYNEISDKLFASKKYGAGEFSDFATYIPGLVATGKNAGIDFTEAASLYSYMTAIGNSAGDANMLLENFINQLGRSDVTAGLEKLGIKVFNAKGEFEDIDKIVLQLTSRLKGVSEESRSNIFENIGLHDMQAKQAFAALLTDSTKLKDIFAGIAGSAGETNKQLELTDNKLRTLTEAGNWFKNKLTSAGEFLVNLDTHIPNMGNSILNSWGNLFTGRQSEFDAKQLEKERLSRNTSGASEALDNALGFNISKLSTPFSLKKSEPFSLLQDNFNFKNPIPEDLTKGKSKDPGIEKGINSIHGGGSQVRNVTVTIHKLVDGGVNVYSTTIKEGMDKVGPIVEEALLKIINGTEQTLMTN